MLASTHHMREGDTGRWHALLYERFLVVRKILTAFSTPQAI